LRAHFIRNPCGNQPAARPAGLFPSQNTRKVSGPGLLAAVRSRTATLDKPRSLNEQWQAGISANADEALAVHPRCRRVVEESGDFAA
jgi:hypothetical protein